ncbi:MAG TPA: enoyl-CoA hydratase/isomerase family protein [Longimicrobiales bacterium]|nr:enoyl-CoA hydratase/isomerase family protein [Longimicrobiales bacterium]
MRNLTRLLYDEREGVGIVSLNRPRKRNALDATMIHELDGTFTAAEGSQRIRVLLLRGEGPDFCAGADLAEMEKIAASEGPLENLAAAGDLGALLVRMRRLRKPIVAAVHGHALAGGAGLASACDLVVAADDATFGYPEVRLGFVPAMVTALLRRALGEKRAFELIATGEPISAERAVALGLANRVFGADGFQEAALEFAIELARRPGTALELNKRLLYGLDGASFEEAIRRGAEINALARLSEEAREGVRRFLDKQKP